MGRAAFWVATTAGLVVTTLAWFTLPERVPLHFGAAGQVDRWGSRTEAVVTMGAIIGGMALLFWVLVLAVPRLPASLVNLPARDKEWWLATPERHEELNRRLVADLYLLGAATVLLVVLLEAATVWQARTPDPALGPWFWVLTAGYLVLVLGYTAYLVTRRYRAPQAT